jgi:hypothetical protein
MVIFFSFYFIKKKLSTSSNAANAGTTMQARALLIIAQVTDMG